VYFNKDADRTLSHSLHLSHIWIVADLCGDIVILIVTMVISDSRRGCSDIYILCCERGGG